ncbi:G2/mitotic-specific cyclin-B-like [Prorops nasuta]|uniref:G2/mitotic-specific cyclin-B-like n=1 Tax=Prorops nasuta TaxID=863751 RepID=UPI0034D01542
MLRSRGLVNNIHNQENVKNIKSTNVQISEPNRRAVLGEIGNKVNTKRGTALIEKSDAFLKDKKSVSKSQNIKLIEKPVQVVKPVAKEGPPIESKSHNPTVVKKDIESFSTELLPIEDIDEDDRHNPSLVSIYINDIFKHLRSLEAEYPINKSYLTGQEITPNMRSILIDWLVDVHQQFRLIQETLYLTVAIIDRFLQTYRIIDRKRLQLVGVTATFIASKYEEMCIPEISDFVYITDNAYSKDEILQMEILILRALNFSFGRPLPLHFLRRYSKAGKALSIHHTMAKYFLEQSLISYELCHYPPSLIAAAALYLAFAVHAAENDETEIWTKTLVHYSTYSKEDVLPIVHKIATIIIKSDKCKYQAVRKKYVQPKFMKVSLRPELKSPIMLAFAQTS